MKVVATRNFRNNNQFLKVEVGKSSHPDQVDKGTIFDLGPERLNPKEPHDSKDPAVLLLCMLFFSGSICEATPENVERIEAEIAQDALREKRASEMHRQRALVGVGHQFVMAYKNAMEVSAAK